MGHGIAHVASRAGYDVVLVDIDDKLLGRAIETVGKEMQRAVDKEKMSGADRQAALARIRTTTDLNELSRAAVAVEAIVERAEAKTGLFRKLDEIIGRSDLLAKQEMISHWKAHGLDFSRIFFRPEAPADAVRNTERQKHPIDDILDRRLIELARPALDRREPVTIELPIRNVDRTAGTMLSGEIAARFGHAGLPDGTITVRLSGTAGMSGGCVHPEVPESSRTSRAGPYTVTPI